MNRAPTPTKQRTNTMNQIIPAILAKTEDEFRAKLKAIDGAAPLVQIDVMDGQLVPNETWFEAEILKSIRTYTRFELHLMVKDPEGYLKKCEGWKQLARVIWHYESGVDHLALAKWARSKGWQVGLALNPKTRVATIDELVPFFDEILVMGNTPGFSGKALTKKTVERATELHLNWLTKPIGFDIGVNAKTIPVLADAGVTRFYAASAIFGEVDPKAAYKQLCELGA